MPRYRVFIYFEERFKGLLFQKTSCSKVGPDACGRGWQNPDTKQWTSFHQISSKSICVTCNIEEIGAPNCVGPPEGYCLCENIKSKDDILACGESFFKLNS